MNILESKVQKRFLKSLDKGEQIDIADTAKRLSAFLSYLPQKQRKKLVDLLLQVRQVQKRNIHINIKSEKIKDILWNNQSLQTKLLTGKISAIIVANFTFGTGRIEDIGLAGAYDVWGFLANESGKELIILTIKNLGL